MSTYKILIIGGDGIGPEVCKIGKSVLESIATQFGHSFIFENALMGHCAIQATGQPLPPETLHKAKNCDAILFGAIGDPSYDNNPLATVRPEQGLLQIRSQLGLFANLRPIQIFSELSGASPLKPEVIANTDILFYPHQRNPNYQPTTRENIDIIQFS